MFQEFLHQFLFGWFPYIAVTVLIFGSILRFDAAQYSWRSESSQFLRRRQMMLGSNLFHMGMLVLLVGHLVGLMTPIWVIDAFGVSHEFKQITAMTVGGIAGVCGADRRLSPAAPEAVRAADPLHVLNRRHHRALLAVGPVDPRRRNGLVVVA